MNMHLKLLFFIAMITCGSVSFSQSNSDLANNQATTSPNSAEKIIKKGDRYLKYNKFVKALELYLEAEKIDPANDNLLYKIGHCYLFSGAASKSVIYFEKAFQTNPATDPDLVLELAQAYHLTSNFEKAIEKYEMVRQQDSKNNDAAEYKIISKCIEECKAGIVLEAAPLNIAFENLGEGVNSEFDDYAFFYYRGDSLAYFTSRRDNTTGQHINPTDNLYYEDIYKVRFEEKNWGKPDNLSFLLNTRLNDGLTGISNKGKTLYLFSGKNGGDIYKSDYENGGWTKPEPLPKPINSEYMDNSFSVTEDGKTAYFVSNRPDNNLGATDIYSSTLSGDENWSMPQNLGDKINTAYEEANVFVSSDGKRLYFSSKGHQTMGGFDIFVSEKDSMNNWQTATNIGSPINSPDNDLYFTIYDSTAFYSSRRESGLGGYDIYGINFLPDVVATDSVIADVKQDSLVTDNVVDEMELPPSLENSVVVNNIVFGMNQSQNTSAYPNLDKLAEYLIKNPDAKIQINGYADSQGGSDYNKKLSEKRALFVSDYLLSKGVKKESFKSSGNGTDNQISVNKNKDGSFNRESLGYNRRVEFVVEEQGTPTLIIEQVQVPEKIRIEEPKVFYSIYVGSSNKQEDFENLKNIPKVEYAERQKNQYVFYIGKYSSIIEAQNKKDELLKQGYTNAYVFKME
jgi:outer membrane protein OmpA-like peptidoglycan-associated protein/tetratricopeptide (TPR) repeat protein